MEIPSWAFASAGKSLSQPERTIIPIPIPVPIQVPIPVPIPVPVYVTKIKNPEPVIDTFYDEIVDIINDVLFKRSTIVDMLLELYI